MTFYNEINFRDIHGICNSIVPGKIFRSAYLSCFQNNGMLEKIIIDNNITCIVDLRTESECSWNPYKSDHILGCRIINLPINTKHREVNFEAKYNISNNEYIQYIYCAKNARETVFNLFTLVDPTKDNMLIHCFSGKDRTGCIIALIELLVGANQDIIIKDYLESKQDTSIDKIELYLNFIIKYGSIESCLISCGISLECINKWKYSLTKNYGIK